VTKLLQKLPFWRRGGKPELVEQAPELRPDDRYRDSLGKPTPEALDDEQAAKARGEWLDEKTGARKEDAPPLTTPGVNLLAVVEEAGRTGAIEARQIIELKNLIVDKQARVVGQRQLIDTAAQALDTLRQEL
jgi:hypothetical protein